MQRCAGCGADLETVWGPFRRCAVCSRPVGLPGEPSTALVADQPSRVPAEPPTGSPAEEPVGELGSGGRGLWQRRKVRSVVGASLMAIGLVLVLAAIGLATGVV